MDTPTLSEMRIGSLVQIQSLKYVVVSPDLGAVATIENEPAIKFLAPSSPVTHWGEANYGRHVTWKAFSTIGS
jgi:hypothetical protein